MSDMWMIQKLFVIVNPFKRNVISCSCQLDSFISVLRIVGLYFFLNSNFNRILCKQTVETLIRLRVLQRLIWVCTVCLCPTKRTIGLYGFKTGLCYNHDLFLHSKL